MGMGRANVVFAAYIYIYIYIAAKTEVKKSFSGQPRFFSVIIRKDFSENRD